MSTKRVLFTGARAPIVAYMARLLYKAGYEVYAADSTYASVCMASRFVKKFIKLPPPKDPYYQNSLCQAVQTYRIDCLIPTCEEIFYISKFKKELERYTRVLCETYENLISLHDKWTFYDYLKKANLQTPHTMLGSQAEPAWMQECVIKPRFSRFASKVTLSKKLPKALANRRHIVQEFVDGKQICSYALAQEGKIIAQCVYEPVLTAGKGAGILLKQIVHPKAEEITARISGDFKFTGQIAFDFIETAGGKLYTIECNPRATSGLGFLGDNLMFFSPNEEIKAANTPAALISRLAVWCYALMQPIKTIRARNICGIAVDFISFKQDPLAWLLQIPIVAWWLMKGLFYGGPTVAGTADIEFNGESIL